MERATIAVFPGDGIGPEVTGQARAVLALCAERFGLQIDFVEEVIGGGAIDRDGTALPDASLQLAKRSDAVLRVARLQDLAECGVICAVDVAAEGDPRQI